MVHKMHGTPGMLPDRFKGSLEMGVGEATNAGRHLWQGSDEVITTNILATTPRRHLE